MSSERNRSTKWVNKGLGTLLALLLAGVLATVFFNRPQHSPAEAPLTEKKAPVRVLSQSQTPSSTSPEGDTVASKSAVETQESAVTNGELAATRRMLAAHNPLRSPEVQDPDSAANRAILQEMILKSIQSRSESEQAR